MFLATTNKLKQLLLLSFIDRVKTDELARGLEEVRVLLGDYSPGFRVISDLSGLDSLGKGAAAEIGKMMEFLDEKGVGMVVRVIPDPKKDIGLNILSLFHYSHRPRTMVCESMAEAMEKCIEN